MVVLNHSLCTTNTTVPQVGSVFTAQHPQLLDFTRSHFCTPGIHSSGAASAGRMFCCLAWKPPLPRAKTWFLPLYWDAPPVEWWETPLGVKLWGRFGVCLPRKEVRNLKYLGHGRTTTSPTSASGQQVMLSHCLLQPGEERKADGGALRRAGGSKAPHPSTGTFWNEAPQKYFL